MFIFTSKCFLIIGIIGLDLSVQLPSELKLCHKSNPKELNECLQESIPHALQSVFNNGNKELGIIVLEPFSIPKLEIKGSQTGSVRLDQTYEDLKMHGFSIGNFRDVNFDLKKCIWDFKVLSPKVKLLSKYTLKGQLLVFPINGHGNSVVDMENILSHYLVTCQRYQKKGKSHLKMTDVKLDIKPEKIHFDFENIIPGNKEVSAQVLATLNENSDAVFNDAKKAYEQVFQQIFLLAANAFFSRIPEDEIFLE